MAHYAAVASVVRLLDDIIRSSQIEFLPSQRILESLFQKFSSLLDFLTDYSSKSGDEEAVAAARRIRDVAYRTQEILLQKYNFSNQISSWDEDELVKLGEQLHSALEDLKKSLPDLQRSSYSSELEKIEPDLQRSCYSCDPTASKLGAVVPVVGLDHLVTKIADQLCSHSTWPKIISIVGMAGIGKTTLATELFLSQLIVDHFDCRAWVTVSQNYNPNKLLQDLLNSFGMLDYYLREIVDTGRGWEHYDLTELVRVALKGRRCLIVLDDLWTDRALYELQEIFRHNHDGSRIVCTTQCAGEHFFVHQVPLLDEENSWILLKQMVNCPPELEFVGRLLATKCGGLPLAIAQLAQILLRNASTPERWEHLTANANSILGAHHGGILFNALSRSYDQLTDQLKACFLYLGSFPDDCEISASKLVKMWVAELIVTSCDRTLE